MTLVNNILEYTEKIAPLATQAQWDNSGLLVGDASTAVSKAMLCLDITDTVIDEAKNAGCELIISHHPVIFTPLSEIPTDHIVYKLIKAELTALCLHTNLDIAENIGVNAQLAKALKLTDTTLYPEEFLCVGNLENEMSDNEFATYVKNALSCKGVRYTNGKNIKIVAVSSGGGGEALLLHKKYDFDALVTGELKHHLFIYANEQKICAVEAGHFNTEDVVISPLCGILKEHFPDVEFIKSKTLTDPVNFI